ncbi:MAG: hypothetical protein DWQ04_31465 [Chloroflexi bacterium]|nr:MAG: hypothetical protein DWQ04_31465 [Chloroflexota bacterium]
MGHLATIFPAMRQRQLPLSRAQVIMLMAAFNEIMLGLDTYLAHVLNNTILLREWIPILFGFGSGIVLLLAGLIAIKNRPLASWLATIVFVLSIVVGVLGAYFHFVRGTLPSAPVGSRVTLSLLIWAPPILAPFAFAGIGVVGLSAAWIEDPINSGIIRPPFGGRIRLPYSKTRGYFFLVSFGILAALVSSVLDHARHGFENPWLWLPLGIGVFATVVSAGIGGVKGELNRGDIWTYTLAMVLLILVGMLGTWFHVQANFIGTSTIVAERFLRGAPFLSPLLYSNMGLLGLMVLLPPGTDG